MSGCAATPDGAAMDGFGPGGMAEDQTTTEESGATGSGTSEQDDSATLGTTTEPGEQSTGADSPIAFDFAIPDVDGVTAQCEAVDILFVIDNSGSMADEQANLVASVPGFVSGIQDTLGSGTDYHVAVVSTDDNPFNGPGCQQLGALVVDTGGDLSSAGSCGPYADGAGYMSRRDSLGHSFDCAARLGIDGSGEERQMDAMVAALASDAGMLACNEGFLRPDALLVLVVISDEDDGYSAGQPIDWYTSVMDAKGGDEDQVVVLSLIGHHKPNDCIPTQWTGMQGAEIALRLIAFTDQFDHGIVRDVCSANYDTYFEEAVEGIATACGIAAG